MVTDSIWIFRIEDKYSAPPWMRTNGRQARSIVAMRSVMYPQSIAHNMLAVILT